MNIIKILLGIGVVSLPLVAFADQKPGEDFTTVTQALNNIAKGHGFELRNELFSMDKIWGSKAFVQYYKKNPEAIKDKQFNAFLLEGLIRLEQFNDPEVREILIANKNEDHIGFWIVEKLKLDNSEAEAKAKTILDNYSASTTDEQIMIAFTALGRKPNELLRYKETLIKISRRENRAESSPLIAKRLLAQMGETNSLFKNFQSPFASKMSKQETLESLAMTNGIRIAIRQDKSKRNTLLKDFRSIMQKEKDPEYRSLALKGITELLDYSRTDPGSDAEVRKFLGEVADSTTETQQIKDKAKEALQK